MRSTMDDVNDAPWRRGCHAAALAAALLAAACGGGGGTDGSSGGGGGGGGGGGNTAPAITLQPVDATTAPSVAATFTAAASGTPAPTLQWELSIDGGASWRALAGASGTSLSAGSSVLGTGVARNNGWRYRVTATNTLGTATSNAAEWRVRPTALGGLPAGLALAPNGELTVLVAPNYADLTLGTLAGREAGRLQRISPAGVVSDVAGGSTPGYVDGPGATARFSIPPGVSYGEYGAAGIARDAGGAVYVPDAGNNRIRKVAPDGTVSTFAGSGIAGNVDGPVDSARFDRPYALAAASDGTVYVLEANRSLRKISGGSVSSLGPVDALALAVDTADTLYVVGARSITRITAAGARSQVGGVTGLTIAEDDSATMVFNALAVDGTGTMYAADVGLCLVRRISADGIVTTLAGGPLTATDRCSFADGNGRAARLRSSMAGMAVDGAGNLYVSDGANLAVRKISPAGEVTTLAR